MMGQVAVVTGSSRGIGKAIAQRLASDGASVVINYRTQKEQAEEIVHNIIALGGKAIAFGADVSQPEEAQALIDTAIKEFGTIDILVNNAGINKDQLMIRISNDEWQQMIDTNLSAAFYCSKSAIKQMMRKRYGRIVAISSIVGLTGNAGQVHYAAAKSGLLGLSASIAREYGPRGITANVVAPGFIESDMTADLNQEQQAKIMSGIAVGRLGTGEDVASLVSFLASREASYVTSQVIRVDGGMAGV
ncbi:MAG: 3-oxoacyl-[acyl-carrier-protein] reductase [Bacillota bacterium]|nr:3-oxoacyl-[acyl-carrier-protein] reductase [Bacillota bacterium]